MGIGTQHLRIPCIVPVEFKRIKNFCKEKKLKNNLI